MKVKITKGNAWYKECVGQVFEVDDKLDYSLTGTPHYAFEDEEYKGPMSRRKFIDIYDAIVIKEDEGGNDK